MNKHIPSIAMLTALLSPPLQAQSTQYETAILAGGCFWCVESDYEKLDGVVDAISGYTDGHLDMPSYEEVSMGDSGHIEAVEVIYDPKRVSYEEILDYYWRHIDPTRDDGQFCDRGPQYRPVIFYRGSKQKTAAYQSLSKVRQNKPFEGQIKVELKPVATFYPAEEYHQDYYLKNPVRYKYYRYACRRDQRVESLWGSH